MLVYYSLYLLLCLFSIRNKQLITIRYVILCIFIGFRMRVGTDWDNYSARIENTKLLEFTDIWLDVDPLYVSIEKVAQISGLGIFLPNLISSLIFVFGTYIFFKSYNVHVLILLVAVPYFYLIVGMGYPRQAMAIGLFCVAIVTNKSHIKLALTILTLTVHYSAIIPILFFFIAPNIWRLSFLKRLFLALTLTLLVIFIVLPRIMMFVENSQAAGDISARYLISENGGMSSAGAIARAVMILPGILLVKLYMQKSFKIVAIILITITLPIIIYLPSTSTFLDRILLYLYPFSFVGLTQWAMLKHSIYREIILFSFGNFVFFYWFLTSVYKDDWVPYSFYFGSF